MIIKFQPIFFDKVWGGDDFKRLYDYPTGENCGEAWGISAHPHGSSIVKNGEYKGRTLLELFENEKQLFGHFKGNEFPILA